MLPSRPYWAYSDGAYCWRSFFSACTHALDVSDSGAKYAVVMTSFSSPPAAAASAADPPPFCVKDESSGPTVGESAPTLSTTYCGE